MNYQSLHYKEQRDLVVYYLLEVVGLSKTAVASILGISPQAVSIQFPTREKGSR